MDEDIQREQEERETTCPECGTTVALDDDAVSEGQRQTACPNCGAAIPPAPAGI
jgi:predicted RNA-binding Zn-ribbon protein involved in translation (DUF1610 family)